MKAASSLKLGRLYGPFCLPMNEPNHELILYDQTRQRLRLTVADCLPAAVDLEPLLTAYAYWVCGQVRRRGADWEETLREYADLACRRAA